MHMEVYVFAGFRYGQSTGWFCWKYQQTLTIGHNITIVVENICFHLDVCKSSRKNTVYIWPSLTHPSLCPVVVDEFLNPFSTIIILKIITTRACHGHWTIQMAHWVLNHIYIYMNSGYVKHLLYICVFFWYLFWISYGILMFKGVINHSC